MRVSELIKNSPFITSPLKTVSWGNRVVMVGICLAGAALVTKILWDYFSRSTAAGNNSLALSPAPPASSASNTSLTSVKKNPIDFRKIFWSDKNLQNPLLQPVFGLPIDIWRTIAGFLDISSILSLSQAFKGLLGLRTDNPVLQVCYKNLNGEELEKIVFGKEDWNRHFGDVGEVDPLPCKLLKALEEQCPFTSGKKVKETHIACWIPEKVNDIPLTLNTLGELVKKPLEGPASKYDDIWDQVVTDHGTTPIKKGHWILLTKTVLEGSRSKSYEQQKQLVENYPGYEMPTLLPTAIALFMHQVRTGEHLYGRGKLWTDTRCREQSGGRPLIVGGFAAGGLSVNCDFFHVLYSNDYIGVAGLRKF